MTVSSSREDSRPHGRRNATDDDESPVRIEVHPGREAIIEFDPETTFECVDSCSWCCHHGVMLYEEDFQNLAQLEDLARSTTRLRGTDFIRREKKARSAHVDDDGSACYFLDSEGKCELQSQHEWKPTRCSIFPLAIERRNDEIYVDIRESAHLNCEGLGVSQRRLVDHLDAFLPELIWKIDDPNTEIVL